MILLEQFDPVLISFGAPLSVSRNCSIINSERVYRYVNSLYLVEEGEEPDIAYDPVPLLPGFGQGRGHYGYCLLLGDDMTALKFLGIDEEDMDFAPGPQLSAVPHSMDAEAGDFSYESRVTSLYNNGVLPVVIDGFSGGVKCDVDNALLCASSDCPGLEMGCAAASGGTASPTDAFTPSTEADATSSSAPMNAQPTLSPKPSIAPDIDTTVPTLTAAPTITPLPCFTSLSVLDEVERNVTNLEVVRDYVLCADTTFFTGFVTNDGDILGGDSPLTLRKNMHVHCGEINGSSDNKCVISRGSFGLTSIPNNFDPPTVNTGVVVRGVTFENAAIFGVLIGLAGDFQFIDCIFTDHQSEQTPVLIEWEGGTVGGGGDEGGGNQLGGDEGGDGGNATRALESSQGRYHYFPKKYSYDQNIFARKGRNRQTATTLKVEFIDCIFKDCISAPNSRFGLVNLGGDGVDVTFITSMFQNNDYNVAGINDASAYGVIVENSGNGALAFNSTCWVGNKAHGNGLVAAYSAELPSVSNDFGFDNEVVYLAALECEFVALVDGNDQTFPNIACADFEADTCALDNEGPTTSTAPSATVMLDSETPTVIESETPTMAKPNSQPTAAPDTSAAFFISLHTVILESIVLTLSLWSS